MNIAIATHQGGNQLTFTCPTENFPQEKREDRSYLRPIIFYRDETGVCLSAASIRCRL